jgi:hypothetical protein
MNPTVRVLHIDPDFQVTYFIFRPGASIQSSVPLQQAIDLLKTETFDLILSEPHNKAILKSQAYQEEARFLTSQETITQNQTKETHANGRDEN